MGDRLSHAVADSYFSAIESRIAALRANARPAIEAAVEAMVNCVSRDGLIYIFGSGHSHMIAEEAHYRAGGLACTVPMLSSATMLHEGAVTGTRLERLEGLADALFADCPIGPKDVLLVASTSGVNAVPVDVARLGKKRGATVIALTSETYSREVAGGRARIADIADIVLDNLAPRGDAAVGLPGGWHVGPVSTVIGTAILNAVLAETAARLIARGVDPPVYTSANLPGAAGRNAELVARYAPRNPHL